MNKLIQDYIEVKNNKIGVMRVGNEDYISLTDIARYVDNDEPRLPIRDWMRNKETISYLGLWEIIHNSNFNRGEFAPFKNEAGSNSFKMSPQKWIRQTNAIGIISKSGRYNSGTYAHSDIAFEFASWLSPEFKLYLITEFKRLKKSEAYQQKVEWNATRSLTKLNYSVHTNAIKENIVPILTDKQKHYIYQEEADLLNVALFGFTAKEWRDNNPELAKDGNIRDYTDIVHLVILNNLEVINASLIESGISQEERLIKLNDIARRQMNIVLENANLSLK